MKMRMTLPPLAMASVNVAMSDFYVDNTRISHRLLAPQRRASAKAHTKISTKHRHPSQIQQIDWSLFHFLFHLWFMNAMLICLILFASLIECGRIQIPKIRHRSDFGDAAIFTGIPQTAEWMSGRLVGIFIKMPNVFFVTASMQRPNECLHWCPLSYIGQMWM